MGVDGRTPISWRPTRLSCHYACAGDTLFCQNESGFSHLYRSLLSPLSRYYGKSLLSRQLMDELQARAQVRPCAGAHVDHSASSRAKCRTWTLTLPASDREMAGILAWHSSWVSLIRDRPEPPQVLADPGHSRHADDVRCWPWTGFTGTRRCSICRRSRPRSLPCPI